MWTGRLSVTSTFDRNSIIYCPEPQEGQAYRLLMANGIRALAYHAGMDAQTRAANQVDFLMEQAVLIVATIAHKQVSTNPTCALCESITVFPSPGGILSGTGRAGRDGGERTLPYLL